MTPPLTGLKRFLKTLQCAERARLGYGYHDGYLDSSKSSHTKSDPATRPPWSSCEHGPEEGLSVDHAPAAKRDKNVEPGWLHKRPAATPSLVGSFALGMFVPSALCGAVGPRGGPTSGWQPLLPTGWQPRDNTPQSELWWAFQKRLAGEAAEYQPRSAGEASGLVLFGDSITERLRCTSLGQPKQEALDDGLLNMVNATFRTRWPAVQLHGVSGDVAEPDLLWRVTEGGELSPQMAADPRLLMSLLIGTNDIGRMNKTAADTHKSVIAVARALLAGSQGLLLINAILPRAPSPFDNGFGNGTRIDWARVHETNALLAQSTRLLGREFGAGRVAFANCTDLPFRGKDKFHVNLRTMPDRVHPNGLGWRQLYDKCLQPELQHLERRATQGA